MDARQRITMAIGTAVALLAALPSGAQTQQKYPSRPIRFVVPFSPGGSTDTMARLVAQKMSDNWSQPVVIENRTGAGGIIGTSLVAKATPDGHTLLVISSAFAINQALNPNNLPYDSYKDFTGVTRLGFSTTALVATPTLGARTLREFIEMARARPGKIFFSSGGAGSATHLNGERFRFASGIKAVHVGFKGASDALLEVVAGRMHYLTTSLLTCLPFIRDGRVLALAVITPVRSPLLPDVPTVAEVIPGYRRDGAHMMLAPAATPRAILSQLNQEVRRVFDLPDVKERLKNFDYVLSPTTPEETDKVIRADIDTFAEVVARAGLRPK